MNNFKEEIGSAQEAKAFLTFLNDSDQLFHLDEDPRDIIKNATGLRLFNEEQCTNLEARLEEVFKYLDNPFEYIIEYFN
jgi:hypothetical protein